VDEKKRSIQAARGHWSVENGNHYKRDASPWQEDRHRHRKPAAALNLALTRNVLLALIPFEQGQPLADFFELYHRHPSRALRLILDSPWPMSLPAKRPGPNDTRGPCAPQPRIVCPRLS
jgi:hypothetical protein